MYLSSSLSLCLCLCFSVPFCWSGHVFSSIEANISKDIILENRSLKVFSKCICHCLCFLLVRSGEAIGISQLHDTAEHISSGQIVTQIRPLSVHIFRPNNRTKPLYRHTKYECTQAFIISTISNLANFSQLGWGCETKPQELKNLSGRRCCNKCSQNPRLVFWLI